MQNLCSSQTDLLLQFFTESLRSEYDVQPISFKRLVAPNHPLVPLYISVIKTPQAYLNQSL